MTSEADIPSLHDLISFQDFEKALKQSDRRRCETCPINGTEFCHLVNPKAKKYTLSEKRAIREEIDRKEKA